MSEEEKKKIILNAIIRKIRKCRHSNTISKATKRELENLLVTIKGGGQDATSRV